MDKTLVGCHCDLEVLEAGSWRSPCVGGVNLDWLEARWRGLSKGPVALGYSSCRCYSRSRLDAFDRRNLKREVNEAGRRGWAIDPSRSFMG